MNEDRAELARTKARELGDTLHAKQIAYGDSGAIALGLWQARLAQYRVNAPVGYKDEHVEQRICEPSATGTHYLIPVELIAHLPRITRLDDRINRIVSNPAGDRMGESPWMDAAGDCIIGEIAPRIGGGTTAFGSEGGCPARECELGAQHDGPHALVDARGRHTWWTGEQPPPRIRNLASPGFGDDMPGLK